MPPLDRAGRSLPINPYRPTIPSPWRQPLPQDGPAACQGKKPGDLGRDTRQTADFDGHTPASIARFQNAPCAHPLDRATAQWKRFVRAAFRRGGSIGQRDRQQRLSMRPRLRLTVGMRHNPTRYRV